MAKTVVLEGIASWAHLVTPGESYDGDPQWEITVTVPKDVAEKWTTDGFQKTTKQDAEGNFYIKVKKPTLTSKGKEQKAPKVRHVEGYVLADDIVGNGSKVRVQVALIDYTYKGKSGTTPRLNAVIVDDLVEYSGDSEGDFFDELPDAPQAKFDDDEGGDY